MSLRRAEERYTELLRSAVVGLHGTLNLPLQLDQRGHDIGTLHLDNKGYLSLSTPVRLGEHPSGNQVNEIDSSPQQPS